MKTDWNQRRLLIWQGMVNLYQENEKITGRNVCTATGISNYMDVLRHMKALAKLGIIKREGKGTKTEWFLMEGPDGEPLPITKDAEVSAQLKKIIRNGQEITLCPPRYARGYEPMNKKVSYER